MTRTHLIALAVSATLLLRGTSFAATLYQYNFDNGTSGSWTPDDASWTICRTVTTGSPEYCQTDATATTVDHVVRWRSRVDRLLGPGRRQTLQLSVRGDWHHRPRARRVSLLSAVAEKRPDDGSQEVVALEDRRRRRHPARVWRPVFPERLLLPAQAHLLQAAHPGVLLDRSGPDLQFVGLCRRHAIPGWKDRPDDDEHQRRLRQRGGEHARRAQRPSLRTHRLHDARESELHEHHRQPEHAVSEFAVRPRGAAHELLRQLSPLAAQLFRADDRAELLHERGTDSGGHEPHREGVGDEEQDAGRATSPT